MRTLTVVVINDFDRYRAVVRQKFLDREFQNVVRLFLAKSRNVARSTNARN